MIVIYKSLCSLRNVNTEFNHNRDPCSAGKAFARKHSTELDCVRNAQPALLALVFSLGTQI